MSGQGATTIDFGAFPGSGNASVAITGQAEIAADALVDAWLVAKATADHSVDEHLVDGPEILAGAVVAGVGFTIYAVARDGNAIGAWSVAWVWNNLS